MVDTLSKFGVPSREGNLQQIQPKPSYRFRVLFVNFGTGTDQQDLTRQVESVGKPQIQHPAVEVHAYNSVAYYAGKHNWSEINLVLKDDISNAASRLVGAQLQKQLNHFEQTGFVAGVNYKFTMFIDTLDGGNTVGTPGTRAVPGANNGILERWTVEGCFISNAQYGDVGYNSGSEYQKINLTIRPDNCTYVGHGGTQVLMPTGAGNLESAPGRPASAIGQTALLS